MVEVYRNRAGDVKPVFKRASNAVKTRAKRPRGSKTTRYDEFGTVWRRTAMSIAEINTARSRLRQYQEAGT